MIRLKCYGYAIKTIINGIRRMAESALERPKITDLSRKNTIDINRVKQEELLCERSMSMK